ncbi:MAG TPA: hypothetical protein VJ914_26065 [Pseudonocardiaceae bacterium]|nr:hypothetical protein [Pseudonocardiaceae bacterium]
MADAVTDRQLVAVLRPFVRACGPALHALRAHEPGSRRGIRVLTSLRIPGTAAWDAMGPQRRVRWWVDRFGRLSSLVTAIPGLGGALADRLPVQDLVGVTAQGVVLCAIAGECGVTDTGTRVRLLASVLFGREIGAELAAGAKPDEDAEVDRLTGQLDRTSGQRAALTVRAVGGTLWRLARSLWGIADELGKRPHGRWYHRLIGLLPLVGAVGDYFGERSGLRTAGKRALVWLHEHA